MNFIKNKKSKAISKDEKQKAKELKKKKRKIVNTTLKIIPYDRLIEDDIAYLGNDLYSKTYKFTDVNYNLGTKDEKQNFLEMYSKILNSFSDKCENIQLTLMNEKQNKKEFINSIMPSNVNGVKEIQEELNKVMIDKINASKNKELLKKNRYITITLKDKSVNSVKRTFDYMETDLKSSFNTVNSKIEEVSNYEKTILFSKIYRDNKNLNWYKKKKKLNYRFMEEKTYIASNYMKFSPKGFESDGKKMTSFVIRDFASYLSDQLLADILSVESELISTINIKPINSAKAQKFIKSKLTNLRASAMKKQKKAYNENFGDDLVTMEINNDINKTLEYSKDLLQYDQKLFEINMIITLISDEENIDSVTESFTNVIQRNLCEADLTFFQQEKAFDSSIPLGINNLKIKRYINTNGLTALCPFDIETVLDKTGFYYGTNIRDEIIMLNRKKLSNLNGFILGSSGSGKSFSAKQDIQNVISYTDDDIIIIDPEREYKYLVETNDGEIINISNTSETHINLFDIFKDKNSDDDTIIEEKCSYLHSVFDLMIGGRYGLEQEELSLLDLYMGNIYREYLQDVENNKMPTLTDLYEMLKNDTSKHSEFSNALALKLEMWVNGSLKVFNNITNVDVDNRIVCYDIKNLDGKLKTLGLLVIIDNIWSRVIKNHQLGKATWIYIDEIHLLFKDKRTLDALENAYKRFRKYGALTTGITQNITDLLNTKEAVTMLSNSEFVKILKQSKTDVDVLQKLYSLTPNQMKYLQTIEPGKGLIKFGENLIPYSDKFPKDSKLFDMFDTNPYSDDN